MPLQVMPLQVLSPATIAIQQFIEKAYAKPDIMREKAKLIKH
jgi:hypothetical protein